MINNPLGDIFFNIVREHPKRREKQICSRKNTSGILSEHKKASVYFASIRTPFPFSLFIPIIYNNL